MDIQLKALQHYVGEIVARQDDAAHESRKIQDGINLGNLVLKNMSTLQSQLRILDSLRQSGKEIRNRNVLEAYPGTFQWMLDPKTAGFYQWLTSMNGLFWVAASLDLEKQP